MAYNQIKQIGNCMANRSKLITDPLLTLAGIDGIPLDENGFLAPLFITLDAPLKHVEDLALIGCWYGQSTLHVTAAKSALTFILKSNPMPKIYIVEAARKEDKRFFSDLPNTNYTARTIGPESEGVWMKEGLWTIGAKEAIKGGATKLVFIDLDCSFVHQNWVVGVSAAFDRYDVMSPHICSYRSGQQEGMSTLFQATKGYRRTLGETNGHPGMALGLTSSFFTDSLQSRIQAFVHGGGDTLFWLNFQSWSPTSRIGKNLPHVVTAADCRVMNPLPKIGHGGQVVVHHPHGPIANRYYGARTAVVKECFPRFCEGVAYLPDDTPCFSDVSRGAVLVKTMGVLKSSGRDWGREEAGALCRKHLREAGLEIYDIPRD